MKTSIIINPVAFRAELYKCFFWYRPFIIHGKKFIAVPSYLEDGFIVSLHNVDDRDDSPAVDPRDYDKLSYLKATYDHHFSAKNCVALRSTSVEDYYNYFFQECSIIEREMKKVVPNQSPISESELHRLRERKWSASGDAEGKGSGS